MHILAGYYWSEFLATPQLFRIDHAHGGAQQVPTLLLKASTLLLKYIVQGSPLELVLGRCGERLLYGVRVFDDVAKPATIWSSAEHEVERSALLGLIGRTECPMFLFNELALNAAWTNVRMEVPREASALIESSALFPLDHSTFKEEAAKVIEGWSQPSVAELPHFSMPLKPAHEWRETVSHYITNRGVDSPIHLFNRDEGGQQEQLAVWLTDNLQFAGAAHSPQVPKGPRRRELTDLLLTHQFGTALIESKTLTIFNRPTLPTRDDLAADVSKHIDKAVAQLRGAVRNIRSGVPIYDKSGPELQVERSQPVHAIVLVPEFDLIQDAARYDRMFMANFMQATKGFLHFLDIAELLRVVQAAEMLAKRGTTTTPMMAFDYYLIERAKKSLAAGTPIIEVLLRITDSAGDAEPSGLGTATSAA